MANNTYISATFDDSEWAKRITDAVREQGMLNVYSKFYKYYRPILKERFDLGSRTTPYEPSSLGKRKRSGEIIRQVPTSLYNRDTDALYKSVMDDVKITDDGMEIKSDVSYAPYALGRFKQKGELAPDGVFKVSKDDISELESILLEEYEDAIGDIPDDLY